MKQFLNSDGKTYNGVKALALISGLSEAEIEWSWKRIKHLMHVDGKSKEEACAIVKEEGKLKPWLSN